jgi:glycosyltransferase involved in cell wall biosynthesis
LRSPKFLLRALYIFPVAVRMAGEMEALGVDQIHAHYATHPALTAWIISRLTDIPFSITVHAHDIYVNRTMLLPKLKDAAFIRAISDFNKKFLIDLYGDWLADKIQVVHCGIHLDKYKPADIKADGDFRIISVGSLQKYKGHTYLLRACKILAEQGSPFQCKIVGGGKLRDSLGDLIQDLGISGQVGLMGPKTEDEVAELLADAQCFVLPSVITREGKMEGIPVVLMEALANKLPVVASDISGIPELIVDGSTGSLVPQKEPQALAEKIIWVSENQHEASKMAELGYQKVKEDFNIEKVIVQLEELFIKVQKSKNGR